jgi:hypothetical protein
MSIVSRLKARQGELFAPPAPELELPEESYQRILRLLARMMNEHLRKSFHPSSEVEARDE